MVTPINLFDLQSVFQCNVTIEEKTLQTVRYDERKRAFLKAFRKGVGTMKGIRSKQRQLVEILTSKAYAGRHVAA